MKSSHLKILFGAFLTWLVPLVVSFGLYNPETEDYLPSYAGFKTIMAVLAAITCYFTMRWIAKFSKLTLMVPGTYLILNSLLDIAVLISLFKMPFTEWATTILPLYVLVFTLVYYLIGQKKFDAERS